MRNITMIFSILFIIGVDWHVSINFNIVFFFPLMTLFVIYLYQGSFGLKSEYIMISIYLLSLFIFWALLNFIAYDKYDDFIASKFLKRSIFGFIILVFTFLFFNDKKNFLVKSIEYALLIIVILWWIQFFVYYTTGEYLDYLSYVSSREQRYQAYWIQAALPIDIIRPTGIFVEPGTYAVNTFPLMVLSYAYHKKLTKLHIALVVSYFLTISLFAILVAILFLVATQLYTLEFRWTRKNLFLVIFFALLFLALSGYLYYRFVVSGGTDQVGYRENIIGLWLSSSSYNLIFGQGVAQVLVLRKAMIEDASFMFKMLFDYGFFALPYLALLFYVSFGFSMVLVLIILITKVHYELYILWFFIAAMAIINEDGRLKRII